MTGLFRSIRFRFTMIIVCVLTLVIGALVFTNSNYLETYTIKTKIDDIGRVMELIEEYKETGYAEEGLVPLEKMVTGANLDVLILENMDTLPRVVYASDITDGNKSRRMMRYFNGQIPKAVEVYDQGDNYVIYLSHNDRLGTNHIDCLGVLGRSTAFVLSTPLESIQEAVELSSRLLTLLGLAAILVGGLLMYVVTLGLTRPIKRLTALSMEMANLNFDVHYEGKSHQEIDVLGDNMNQMSERLRQTIEDLRRANEQLEKDLREKERVDEMRRQFLANVSHELKTPIALIQGYAEGLKDGISDDPESMDYYCDVIIDESRKMNTIVKRLLNLDEIENGSIHLEWEWFDLKEVLEGVVRSSEKLLPEGSQVRFSLELPEELPVYADQFLIEQVVQNYLSNACHYVSENGLIRISSESSAEATTVRVFNSGSPIPEEDLEHIWEKFFKVDKARTRSYGGSGIGLSIVKAIMNLHGGDYGVINREDGVEFFFTLKKKENA